MTTAIFSRYLCASCWLAVHIRSCHSADCALPESDRPMDCPCRERSFFSSLFSFCHYQCDHDHCQCTQESSCCHSAQENLYSSHGSSSSSSSSYKSISSKTPFAAMNIVSHPPHRSQPCRPAPDTSPVPILASP